MEKETDEKCLVCGAILIDKGYDGDWKVLDCSSPDCNASLRRPVSNPSDGFTMEDLNNISDYVD